MVKCTRNFNHRFPNRRLEKLITPSIRDNLKEIWHKKYTSYLLVCGFSCNPSAWDELIFEASKGHVSHFWWRLAKQLRVRVLVSCVQGSEFLFPYSWDSLMTQGDCKLVFCPLLPDDGRWWDGRRDSGNCKFLRFPPPKKRKGHVCEKKKIKNRKSWLHRKPWHWDWKQGQLSNITELSPTSSFAHSGPTVTWLEWSANPLWPKWPYFPGLTWFFLSQCPLLPREEEGQLRLGFVSFFFFICFSW